MGSVRGASTNFDLSWFPIRRNVAPRRAVLAFHYLYRSLSLTVNLTQVTFTLDIAVFLRQPVVMVKKAAWKQGVMTGKKLKDAIEKMRLTPNAFAKIALKDNGKPLSQNSISNIINNPSVVPEGETMRAIERALKMVCPHCGQYVAKKNR